MTPAGFRLPRLPHTFFIPFSALPKTETARELGLPGASWGQNYCLIALESRVLHGAGLALSLISSW